MRTTKLCWAFLISVVVACGPSSNSGDDTPTDAMRECATEGDHRCSGATYQTCTDGTWQTALDCPMACVENLGCVDCAPGQPLCQDGDVYACDDTGMPGNLITECTGQTTCAAGACVDACMEAATSKSYISCEYWATDLDNAVEVLGSNPSPFPCTDTFFGYGAGALRSLSVCKKSSGGNTVPPYAGQCDPPNNTCPTNFTCTTETVCALSAQASPFAVVVSNPQAKDVNVVVTGPGGQTINRVIPAGQVSAILPQMGGAIPDQSIDGTFKGLKAYKVTSDLPIVAYQFNPLDNVDVFSNDASLLIPRTSFGTDYYALTWPTLDRRTPAPGAHPFYGYITIVGWQDGTQIEVTPTWATVASTMQATLAAGVPVQFTLNAHEVLQLQASVGGDLTGTHITSPNMMSFGVFGGHEAAAYGETTSPDPNYPGRCCADHLEEMLFPSETWGKSFAIARSKLRTNEPDVLRILAQKAGTTITFTPAPMSGTCGTLAPGQFCDVKIMDNTEIVASEPVLIGHFLQSSSWYRPAILGGGKIGNGDPSMAIAVPAEQFRRDYAILVPAEYTENYVSIAAPATGGVSIDGMPVTLVSFPGGGTHRAAVVPVTAGSHKITCADGCGITVYGYSDAVSYMFAGGLDLKPIVIL